MKLQGISSYSKKRWKTEFPELSDQQIDKLHKLASGKLKTTEFVSVQQWEKQCYTRPSFLERAMCALNEILNGNGTESITIEGAYIDSYYGDIVAEYINMGDTYSNTILLDHATGRFIVTSWGDWYENIEHKYTNGREL